MEKRNPRRRPLWMTAFGEEGPGNVFTDRLTLEWPLMNAQEVSEEEYFVWSADRSPRAERLESAPILTVHNEHGTDVFCMVSGQVAAGRAS